MYVYIYIYIYPAGRHGNSEMRIANRFKHQLAIDTETSEFDQKQLRCTMTSHDITWPHAKTGFNVFGS